MRLVQTGAAYVADVAAGPAAGQPGPGARRRTGHRSPCEPLTGRARPDGVLFDAYEPLGSRRAAPADGAGQRLARCRRALRYWPTAVLMTASAGPTQSVGIESWTSRPRTTSDPHRFVIIYRRRDPEGHGRRGRPLSRRDLPCKPDTPTVASAAAWR